MKGWCRIGSFIFSGYGIWCMIVNALHPELDLIFVLGILCLAIGGKAWHEAEIS